MVSAVLSTLQNTLKIAFGGSLPELVYAGVALWFVRYLPPLHELAAFDTMKAAILAFFALYFFLQKIPQHKDSIQQSKASFFRGLWLGLLNVQLLPFWVGVLIFFGNSYFSVNNSMFASLSFGLGAWLGALCLLLVIVAFSVKYKAALQTSYFFKNVYKLMAGFFLILCIIQVIQIIYL